MAQGEPSVGAVDVRLDQVAGRSVREAGPVNTEERRKTITSALTCELLFRPGGALLLALFLERQGLTHPFHPVC